MTSATIYQEIAQRTGGDIYIGVVGPVRTGKSTLILPHQAIFRAAGAAQYRRPLSPPAGPG